MPRPSTTIAIRARNILAAALLPGLFAGGAAIADDTWPVHGKLQGNNDKKSEDVSGIACTVPQGFPRACLVIDDNAQAAQFVTVEDGEIQAGDMMPLIDNRFKVKALELDGEGVVYSDGFFYVIGSHGHPRDSEHKLAGKKLQPGSRRAARSCASALRAPTICLPSKGKASSAQSSSGSRLFRNISTADSRKTGSQSRASRSGADRFSRGSAGRRSPKAAPPFCPSRSTPSSATRQPAPIFTACLWGKGKACVT